MQLLQVCRVAYASVGVGLSVAGLVGVIEWEGWVME